MLKYVKQVNNGIYSIQDYPCQISAYKPTEITHSVKIRGKNEPEIMKIIKNSFLSKASDNDLAGKSSRCD